MQGKCGNVNVEKGLLIVPNDGDDRFRVNKGQKICAPSWAFGCRSQIVRSMSAKYKAWRELSNVL